MSRLIGIDLGTTKSCMAILEGGEPTVIANAEGEQTTPSVVAFTDAGPRVGTIAKLYGASDPTNTVCSIGRLMGRTEAELRDERSIMPYGVVAGSDGDAHVAAGGKQYSPSEITAMILGKLKRDAEAHLGEAVDRAVITVPACFNDDQRQATKHAGTLAGLDVSRIINSPSAGALAYGHMSGSGLDDTEQTILVFDLGGGTVDASVLEIGDGVFYVRTMAGDTQLGGDDFDDVIVGWIVEELDLDLDLDDDPAMQAILCAAARKARTALTVTTETELVLPLLVPGPHGMRQISRTLSRSAMESLVAPLVERVKLTVQRAIEDAREYGVDVIDRAILLGGMSATPIVRRSVKEVLDVEPVLFPAIEHAPALGAAMQAGVMTGELKEILLLDVIALTLGIETKGGVITTLIERNTTIPTRKGEVFTTAEDNQPTVEVHVLQGERELAQHNKSLGKFQFSGIPPAPQGVPQIEVVFDIDIDGMMSVAAKDLGTGKEQKLESRRRSEVAEQVPTTARANAEIAVEVVGDEAVRTGSPVGGDQGPAEQGGMESGVEAFISYSHRDDRFRVQLETHLALLRRQGLITTWHDRLIEPGDNWEQEIDSRMRHAKLILLLISPDFLASDYCYDREMKTALERHEAGEAHVVPIILRPVDWAPGPFGHLQALPQDAKPVIQWSQRDSAWFDVSSGLRAIVTEILRQEKREHPHRS